MNTINERGLNLVKAFEHCKLEAYLDSLAQPPIYTIGYGRTHMPDGSPIAANQLCTQEQADAWLANDLYVCGGHFLDAWLPKTTVLNEDQYAAFSSFVFNVGCGTFRKSGVFMALMNGDIAGACNLLLDYDKAGGVVVKGLQRRRRAEAALIYSNYPLMEETIAANTPTPQSGAV